MKENNINNTLDERDCFEEYRVPFFDEGPQDSTVRFADVSDFTGENNNIFPYCGF